jgi:hypothetical protein
VVYRRAGADIIGAAWWRILRSLSRAECHACTGPVFLDKKNASREAVIGVVAIIYSREGRIWVNAIPLCTYRAGNIE